MLLVVLALRRDVITTPAAAYNFECRVKAKLAQLIMNYPSKALTTQLGTCFLESCEFKMEVRTCSGDFL